MFFCIQKNISFKQSLITIIAVFISGLFLSSIQIYRDFKESIASEEINIERMIDVTKPSAAQALYHIDRKQAEEIINGFMSYESIIYASLTDNFGSVLYEKYAPRFKERFSLLKIFYPDTEIFNFKLIYSPEQNSPVFVGRIKLQTDYLLVYKNFISKTRFIILTNLIFYLSLALIFISIFKKNITRPLLDMASEIARVDPKKTEIHSIKIPIQHRYNEIGSIIKNINSILNEYSILKNKLEEKVYQRTLTLEKSNDRLKNSLEQLQETTVQLIESEKMASIGRLVSGISHEINTPMGNCLLVASSFNKTLNKVLSPPDPEKIDKDDYDKIIAEAKMSMDIILKNLQQSSSLVKSLKKIAVDQEYSEPKPFILTTLVGDIITSIKPQLKGKNIHISTFIRKEIHLFEDPSIFSQIINNLIVNSMLHGFDKKNEGEIKLSVSACSKRIAILYKDTGKGIDKKIVSKIFEPFFTTSRQHGGSGIGMHIVYNLVTTKLKGKIKYLDTKEKGAAFIISFPYRQL